MAADDVPPIPERRGIPVDLGFELSIDTTKHF